MEATDEFARDTSLAPAPRASVAASARAVATSRLLDGQARSLRARRSSRTAHGFHATIAAAIFAAFAT